MRRSPISLARGVKMGEAPYAQRRRWRLRKNTLAAKLRQRGGSRLSEEMATIFARARRR